MRQRNCAKHLVALLSGLVLISLFSPVNLHAQEAASQATGAARKFDEFTRVGGCDHSARLDNFAIQLQTEPETIGYVIAYGPEGEGSGTGNFRLRVSLDYLVNSRGIDPQRIKTIYGGRYKDLEESVSELWIAPPGAEAPEIVKYENKAGEFTGKFIEEPTWDGPIFEGDETTGPPIGDVTLASFADMLRLQEKSYAYIVVYEDDESKPGAWGRISARVAKGLQVHYGVSADRTKIIFGGYDKKSKLQLWILPMGAPPPVEEVKKERQLQKNIQLGSYGQYELNNADGARSVFEEFADVLRKDKDLKVVFIVRPEVPFIPETSEGETSETMAEETVAVSDEQPAEVAAEEAPDVDFLELIEKWKKVLAKEYKIGENRVIVMMAAARDESESGRIETWVVPPGIPLPDLYPPQEEFLEEASEENPPER
jgi:hypothetical protein